jgi:hypothetical protein
MGSNDRNPASILPYFLGAGLLLAVSLLLIAGVPLVDHPMRVNGCWEAITTPPARARITLWEQWKWERQIQDLIRRESASHPAT